jgi:hypothetical protein
MVCSCCIDFVITRCSYIEDPKSVIECLMHSRAVTLPSHIQAVYMQAVLKIFSQILSPRIVCFNIIFTCTNYDV